MSEKSRNKEAKWVYGGLDEPGNNQFSAGNQNGFKQTKPRQQKH